MKRIAFTILILAACSDNPTWEPVYWQPADDAATDAATDADEDWLEPCDSTVNHCALLHHYYDSNKVRCLASPKTGVKHCTFECGGNACEYIGSHLECQYQLDHFRVQKFTDLGGTCVRTSPDYNDEEHCFR